MSEVYECELDGCREPALENGRLCLEHRFYPGLTRCAVRWCEEVHDEIRSLCDSHEAELDAAWSTSELTLCSWLPTLTPPATPKQEPAQEKTCTIEGCGGERYRYGQRIGPYCWPHESQYGSKWRWCGCGRWIPGDETACGLHGGKDYEPRRVEADHQETVREAQPGSTQAHRCEGKGCDRNAIKGSRYCFSYHGWTNKYCAVNGCEGKPEGYFCGEHQKAWHDSIVTIDDFLATAKPAKQAHRCEAEGCEREAAKGARYCGEPHDWSESKCCVRGCEEARKVGRLCATHRRQWSFASSHLDFWAWLASLEAPANPNPELASAPSEAVAAHLQRQERDAGARCEGCSIATFHAAKDCPAAKTENPAWAPLADPTPVYLGPTFSDLVSPEAQERLRQAWDGYAREYGREQRRKEEGVSKQTTTTVTGGWGAGWTFRPLRFTYDPETGRLIKLDDAEEALMSTTTPKPPLTQVLKADAVEGAYLSAASQTAKIAREAVVNAVCHKHKGSARRARKAAALAILDSEPGRVLLYAALATIATLGPGQSSEPLQRLARALRIKTIEEGGNALADLITTPALSALSSLLSGAEEAAELTAKGLEVREVERIEIEEERKAEGQAVARQYVNGAGH